MLEIVGSNVMRYRLRHKEERYQRNRELIAALVSSKNSTKSSTNVEPHDFIGMIKKKEGSTPSIEGKPMMSYFKYLKIMTMWSIIY